MKKRKSTKTEPSHNEVKEKGLISCDAKLTLAEKIA
jgi:hypothetical protein